MPATTVYQLPYPAATDPADVPADMQRLANRIEVAVAPGTAGGQIPVWDNTAKVWAPRAQPSYGTTLPASPADGQEHVLVDSTTNPTYTWRFRFNASSSSAYKWEFVGGAPAFVQVGSQESTTTVATWLNLTTIGPQFIAPRAGDYLALANAYGVHSVSGTTLSFGIAINDTTPSITGAGGAAGANGFTAQMIQQRATVVAGDALRARYYNGAAGTAQWGNRQLCVTPVRVS